MKVLNKPIQMIADFENDKLPRPIRFKVVFEDSGVVVSVDRILVQHELKIAGNPYIAYTCQSVISDVERLYELRFEVRTCRWVLFKL